MRLALSVVALAVFGACGGGGGHSSASPSSTVVSAADLREQYASAVEDALNSAEQHIAAPEADSLGGWGKEADAWNGFAAALEKLEVPAAFTVKNGAVVSEARRVATDAEQYGRTRFDRSGNGGGLAVAAEAHDLKDHVAAFVACIRSGSTTC